MLAFCLLISLFVACKGMPVYEGRTFALTFFPNYVSMYGRSVTGHLYFRSTSGGSCSVTDDDGAIHDVRLNSTNNSITQFDLPGGKFYNLGTYVQKRGIYVNCSIDVSLYSLSTRDNEHGAASAYYALPVSALTNHSEYMIPSVPNNAMFGVVGIYDDTNVTIDIKSNCPFQTESLASTQVLHFRDVYQAASMTSGRGVNCDMGGTYIRSNKPVSLLSGGVILVYPGQHGDHVVNQVPPLAEWGTTYIVPQVVNMDKYTVRIIAAHNDTNVTIYTDATKSVVLQSRQVYSSDFDINTNVYISSSHPVLVSQISGNDQGYDAFTNLILPISQYTSHYILPDLQASGRHFNRYVTVITEADCVPYIPVKADWSWFTVDSKKFAVATFQANETLRELITTRSSCTFGAQLTGFATYEAYAFFATP